METTNLHLNKQTEHFHKSYCVSLLAKLKEEFKAFDVQIMLKNSSFQL